MRLPLRQHPVVALVGLLVVAALVWGLWPQAVLVEGAVVRRAPLTVTIEEEGRTRVIDRYVISAPVDGVACRAQLDVGDRVERGQLLLSVSPLESQALDPRRRGQAAAQVAAAESALRAAQERARAAEAAADLARTEFARLRPLLSGALVSRDAVDRAAAQVTTTTASARSAKFDVDVARNELELARTTLDYTAGAADAVPAERFAIRSPIDGRVLKVAHECEGPVRTGEPLLEVGDPSALEVEVDVLSDDAVRVHPGMRVVFDRWGGAEPLEGVVRTVEPVGFTKVSALGVEEQRVLIIADFVSPPEQWQRLGDGYRVEARFILWRDDDVLQVPASSLFRRGPGWSVFVVEDGRARVRAVEIGQRTGLAAQVLAGVAEGETLVVHPSDEVEDGRRVALR